MKRILYPGLLAIALAVATHCAAIFAFPYLRMELAMRGISGNGERINTWQHARRVTPESRRIVRPAPEFAYSSCVYDLSRGPVRIHVAPSPQYWSLSLYAANTDNFATLGDRDHPGGVDVELSADERPGTIRSPSTRGIALIRRLVPDTEGWKAIGKIRKEDVCAVKTG